MKKIKLNFIKFILVILFLSANSAIAHKSETHDPETFMDPVTCIPENERTKGQLKWDIYVNKQFHRLSKRQVNCAIVEIQKLNGLSGQDLANKFAEQAKARSDCGSFR